MHKIFLYTPLLLILSLMIYMFLSSQWVDTSRNQNTSIDAVSASAAQESSAQELLEDTQVSIKTPAPKYPHSVVFANPIVEPQIVVEPQAFCEVMTQVQQWATGTYFLGDDCEWSSSGLYVVDENELYRNLFQNNLSDTELYQKIQDFELLINKQVQVTYEDADWVSQEIIINI